MAQVVGVGGSALVRLVSSVVLTRLLNPDAYGLVTILWSIFFIAELASDIGVVGLIIRHKRGEDAHFINTLWTIKFFRGLILFTMIFLAAPAIAHLYDLPLLTSSIRLFSLTLILSSLESMSFLILLRRREARVKTYVELAASIASTAFTIAYAYHSRDHYALIYGVLFQRALITITSYLFVKEFRPRFEIEIATANDLFGFARVVIPSSLITIVISQYERVILLKLFSLQLLGLYGLAANIASSLDGLVSSLSRNVLYPRFSQGHREESELSRDWPYRIGGRALLLMIALPALLFGTAQILVELLYDARYSYAGMVLGALSIRVILAAVTSPREDLLVAAGHTQVVLIANALRLLWLVPSGLVAYHFWGFNGFLYASVFDLLPALLYLIHMQHKAGLFNSRYELIGLVWLAAIASTSWFFGNQLVIVGKKFPFLSGLT